MRESKNELRRETPVSSSAESNDNDDENDVEVELLSLTECSDDVNERPNLASCRRSLPCSLTNSSRVFVSLTWLTCRL